MLARVVSANGRTGTTMPYTNMSVKMAVATVMMMKVLELRRLRRRGGFVGEPVSQANIFGVRGLSDSRGSSIAMMEMVRENEEESVLDIYARTCRHDQLI